MNKLSAAQVKSAGPGKYSDGGGLWLHKRPDGGAQWFLRVTVHRRRREMGLGSLMHVSLKEAREEADRWRAVARQGIDPIKERARLSREANKADHALETIAREAFEARKAELKGDGTAGRWFSPLELHVLPKLGRVPVEEIDQRDIKTTLAPIWHTKADTARKAMNRLGIVLRHVPREVAETALAHVVGGSVERAYRRTDYLDQRRELMELWAGHVTKATDGRANG